jgi:poly(hydroxyalkanoate) depolymerase family esterase
MRSPSSTAPRTPRRRRPPHRLALACVLSLVGALLTAFSLAGPATAAGLTQVTGFGSNPGNLSMYAYVPDGLPSGAPLVVALHGCTQSADDYSSHSGWPQLADRWKFAVVFPQTSSANNAESCFSWFDATKDTRGKGEAASVKQMVDTAVADYGSDPARIYVTGLSAGGGMTADLLADYPDVFAGGAVDSGLPAQCATTLTAASGCQYSDQNLTPQAWGDKVRSSDPGYTGPWPRVAIWQGTSDYTVYPVNGDELRDQWTDVWGIGQDASGTQSLPANTTETYYDGPDGASGTPAVALFSVSGMGHGLAVDPGSGDTQCGSTGTYYLDTLCSSYYTGLFWGLDGGTSGGGGGGSLPAPTGLTATGTTDSSVSLSWSPVSGAASYTVYRDGTQVTSTTATSYTDTGLAAGTSYRYTVAAADSSGTPGAASAPLTASTTGSPGGGGGTCYTATNYDHVAAGRAHTTGGDVYANGSDQDMGLYNVFVTHTLQETSPGYYVIADGSCTG